MNAKPRKVTQKERDENFERLLLTLEEYYKILAADFDAAHDEEDEEWLDYEMKRVETFLDGLSQDKMNDLRHWNEAGEVIAVEAPPE